MRDLAVDHHGESGFRESPVSTCEARCSDRDNCRSQVQYASFGMSCQAYATISLSQWLGIQKL